MQVLQAPNTSTGQHQQLLEFYFNLVRYSVHISLLDGSSFFRLELWKRALWVQNFYVTKVCLSNIKSLELTTFHL